MSELVPELEGEGLRGGVDSTKMWVSCMPACMGKRRYCTLAPYMLRKTRDITRQLSTGEVKIPRSMWSLFVYWIHYCTDSSACPEVSYLGTVEGRACVNVPLELSIDRYWLVLHI